MNDKPYIENNVDSIYDYATGLIGKTFAGVLGDQLGEESAEYAVEKKKYDNPRSKGGLGNLIEEHYFGIIPNNNPLPDFDKAGLELKVTPFEKTKTGKYRAGERLIIGMIPNSVPVPNSFYESHAFEKLKLILFVFYQRVRDCERTLLPIKYVQIFDLMHDNLKDDLKIIESDYKIIIDKIKAGKAHELSESDTMYLGAATKGASAKKSLQPQYYNPDVPAKRRAFSLKQGYMTNFLNKYVILGEETYESITNKILTTKEFENEVLSRINQYVGWTEEELIKKFNINPKEKSRFATIAFRILGITSNNAEEFVKSETVLKTIRIEQNNRIKEDMSFKVIDFIKFVKTDWEDSYIYDYFSRTRFLFVLFKKQEDGPGYTLSGAKFWHMPSDDLENTVREEWLTYQQAIQNGVTFTISGKRILNSLPPQSETEIIHLRPKAAKAAYKFDDVKIGNINRDANLLPNGDYMTKQCFWFNKSYVMKQLGL